MDDDYQVQNDGMYKNDDLNHMQQQQYIQKRRMTTASRTFINRELTAMNHNLKKRNDKHIDESSSLTPKFNNNHRNQQQSKLIINQKFSFLTMPFIMWLNSIVHL